MNLPYRFTAFAFAAATLGFTGMAQQSSPTVSGHWQGSLKVGSQDLVIVVDLAKNAKGTWIGSFSMPELGATDIPVDQLTVGQTKVHFVVTATPGSPSFDGNLSADGNELTGTFSDPQTKSPLTLRRVGTAHVKLPLPNTPLTKDFEGTWHATLGAGDSQIRMLLKLTRAPDGTATGTVVNVDQGNREVPLTSIQQKDKLLEFDIRSVAVRFHGTLNAAGGAVAGEWSQMSHSAALIFERGGFPPNSPLTKAFDGTWQATLDAGGEYKIVLALTLTRAADGTAAGTLKNTSEPGKELPLTAITLKNKSMEFSVQGLSATYSGTLNNAGTEITGTWTLAGTALPLTFKHLTAADKKP
jgi:hypothetical protein